MASWDEIEKVGRDKLDKIASQVTEYLAMSDEEKLLRERRRRRIAFRKSASAYLVVNLVLWIFFLLIAGTYIPAAIVSLFWGIGMALHTIHHYGWLSDNAEALEMAEEKVRLEGNVEAMKLLENSEEDSSAYRKLSAGSSKKGEKRKGDPLLLRCEAAAEETRARIAGLGSGEVDVLAIIDESLDRVRDLLAHRAEIQAAIRDAGQGRLDEERERLRRMMASTRDADARSLYQSQWQMLEARAEKVDALKGLQERFVAYAESYLAAMTNLRLDATRLKAVDLPSGAELQELSEPLKDMEQQMEGMRAAMAEVAQLVGRGQR